MSASVSADVSAGGYLQLPEGWKRVSVLFSCGLPSLSWRIVSLNLLGSIAFGVPAVASLLEPSSGEPISARISNAGTALVGVCFLIAALALMPEAARQPVVSQADGHL